ncbi:MAG TPA: GNAT family N-acetyltransferase [Anaerolineales bacterium]|nr:GNAT family N-acetyltransferase [Anaerolineales bacterium]
MTFIRPATASDVGAIAGIHIAAWLSTYRGLMPDSALDNLSFERRRDWWKGVMEEHPRQVMVAQAGNQILGFSYFGKERERDPIYGGGLSAFYLLADYQRKGFGRLLVKAAAQGLLELGVSNLLLWVLSTNPARSFYEKLGGCLLRDRPFEMGGTTLQEAAHGWDDIHPLAEII